MLNAQGRQHSPRNRESGYLTSSVGRRGLVSSNHNQGSGITSNSSNARFSRPSAPSPGPRYRIHPPSAISAPSPLSGSPLIRPRARSREASNASAYSPRSPAAARRKIAANPSPQSSGLAKARAKNARKENDSMVYLDGPQVYTCGQCRTHLTSHDDIISKSFHGRHGRAYLFDQCVNITIGPAEDRLLITGLHSVCDIFCKRCKGMIGWTYAKAYESSQKYKEGKYIIEKINLHLEESNYDVKHPAGERPDRWRLRSMSWGSETCPSRSPCGEQIVYEYRPSSSKSSSLPISPRYLESANGTTEGSSPIRPRLSFDASTSSGPPPAPPLL